MLAAHEVHKHVVMILLANGAKPDMKLAYTALFLLAMCNKHDSVAERIKEYLNKNYSWYFENCQHGAALLKSANPTHTQKPACRFNTSKLTNTLSSQPVCGQRPGSIGLFSVIIPVIDQNALSRFSPLCHPRRTSSSGVVILASSDKPSGCSKSLFLSCPLMSPSSYRLRCGQHFTSDVVAIAFLYIGAECDPFAREQIFAKSLMLVASIDLRPVIRPLFLNVDRHLIFITT